MIYRRIYAPPAGGYRTAFGELDRLRRQFDALFGGDPDVGQQVLGAGVFPQINLTEDADRFIVRAELPGVQSQDIDIQATSKNLTLAGERKIEDEQGGVRYHRREREAGRFSRILSLPSEIDPGKVEAKLKDGVLTIRIPKAEAVKPRQIAIS